MIGDMALDPDLAILVTEIEANLSHLETIVHGLTDAQFNWRPEPGRWSIAECVAHLNIVDGGDLAPIQAAIEEAHARKISGSGPFTYGYFSKKFVASMEPPVTRKFKAPKAYVPPPDAPLDKTVAEFRRIGAELRRLTVNANGLHLGRVKCPLPALPPLLRPFVKMPLGARLALLTAHDRRHLWQAEQVRNHPDFPKP
jgi:hypothetical protein